VIGSQTRKNFGGRGCIWRGTGRPIIAACLANYCAASKGGDSILFTAIVKKTCRTVSCTNKEKFVSDFGQFYVAHANIASAGVIALVAMPKPGLKRIAFGSGNNGLNVAFIN